MNATSASLSNRLENLERSCSRLRLWCVLLSAVTLTACLSSALRPAPEIISAREFRVVDERGVARGTFGPDNDTPAAVSLTLNRKGIDQSVRLLSGPEQSELVVAGDDDSGAIWLAVSGSRADLALLTPVAGTMAAVVSFSANELAGSLLVSKVEETEVPGGRGFGTVSSFRWPDNSSERAKTGK